MTFFERFVRVYGTIKRFIVITSVEFLLRIPARDQVSSGSESCVPKGSYLLDTASIYRSWFQGQLVELKLLSCRSM